MRATTDYVKEDLLKMHALIALQKYLEERLDSCLKIIEDDTATGVSEKETSISAMSSTRVTKISNIEDHLDQVTESIDHAIVGLYRPKRRTTQLWKRRHTGTEESTFKNDEYFVSDRVSKSIRVQPYKLNHYGFKTIPKHLRAVDQNDTNEGIENV